MSSKMATNAVQTSAPCLTGSTARGQLIVTVWFASNFSEYFFIFLNVQNDVTDHDEISSFMINSLTVHQGTSNYVVADGKSFRFFFI